MNRKERRGAIRRVQDGSALSTPGGSSALLTQAIRQHQFGDFASAEAICRTILSQNPKDAGGLSLLGAIAQQGGRFEEAAVCFGSLVNVDPASAPAYRNLGGALAAAGRHEEATAAIERAVALGQGPAGVPDIPECLLLLGNLYAGLNRPEQAAQRFNRALALRPDYAQAHNDFGAMLLARGELREASRHFVRALELAPELLESAPAVLSLLSVLNPALAEGLKRAFAAWPALPDIGELLGTRGLDAISGDLMLRRILTSAPVRTLELERFLTSVRAGLLKAASLSPEADDELLHLSCALARQCFINEYVFTQTTSEQDQVELLARALKDALANSQAVSPLWCAVVASYRPLSSLGVEQALLAQAWPEAIEQLLTQQIREVRQELQLRNAVPRLTAIEEGASTRVRSQYEENPYPRWVLPPSSRSPAHRQRPTVDEHLQSMFPLAPLRPVGGRVGVDILVAGCGTGEHPIGMSRQFREARVLAVDLSLNSLAYARRKTLELGLQNIEYAQADILRLGSLDRSFDVIDASGVLHHMADPAEGWRTLLRLLRANGVMRIGLYSELGRADITAARNFIMERGFRPDADDIRRCRQEMLASPMQGIARYGDFFSASECRDMLFHVEERRLTIPQIRQFLAEHGLTFIGFELDAETAAAYRARFPNDAAMTDLDSWHTFETARPTTFAAMYKFWCQPSG